MRLGVFFTYGYGLEFWRKTAEYARRQDIYRAYRKEFDSLLLFTYDEKRQREFLPKSQIIHRGARGKLAHSLIGPIRHRKQLQKCNVLTSIQMIGAWSAIIAHIAARRPLVLRQGYSWSAFERNAGNWVKYVIARKTEFAGLLFSKAVIVTTNEQRQSLGRINIARTPIHVIPNGIDTDRFKPRNAKATPRSLLFVGRLHEQKNLRSLLHALEGMDCMLTLAGEGPLDAELKALARELKVDTQFLGRVANEKLPLLMAKHEVFVFPSLYEGNPKALLEAMSCGMRVVASNVEGNRGLVEDGENGMLCGTDAGSIRKAITRALAAKKGLGSAARKTILDEYSQEKTIQQELEVLRWAAA